MNEVKHKLDVRALLFRALVEHHRPAAGGGEGAGPDALHAQREAQAALQALEGAVPGFDRSGRRITRLALLKADETEF